MTPMKQRSASEYKPILRAGRWFSGIPDALQKELLDAASVRALGAGERLFARGDPPSGLFAVVEGGLRISGTGASGEVALLTIAEPPTWFGEVSLFDEMPRTHDAVAEVDSVVVQVPQAALERILEAEPRYWRDFGRMIATKLRLLFEVMEDAALLPLPVRLARRLLMMAQRHGEWQDRSSRTLELKQEQLAQMLATSRQTVNQLLKELEAKGVVRLSYGVVEIVDLPALRRAAD